MAANRCSGSLRDLKAIRHANRYSRGNRPATVPSGGTGDTPHGSDRTGCLLSQPPPTNATNLGDDRVPDSTYPLSWEARVASVGNQAFARGGAMMALPKSESRVAARQFANQENSESALSVPLADDACNGRAIATLSARLALAGFAMHRLDSGGFLVCRWGLTKHCPDTRALAGFAHQVGARA